MAFDFFTIQNLAAELDEAMSGATITRACSIGVPGPGPNPAERSGGGRIPDLALAWGSDVHLASWLGRGGGLCQVPGGPPHELRQTIGPERYLAGATVDRVRADRGDRLIRIGLWRADANGAPSWAELVFELIEPHFQAVLKSEQTQKVVGCWRGRGAGGSRIVKGQPYTPIPGSPRLIPGEADRSEYFDRIRAEPTRTLNRALGVVLAGADRSVADEILYRAAADGAVLVPSVDEATLSAVWQVACDMYVAHGRGSSESFMWEERGSALFSSLKPLRPVRVLRHCTSVSDAVRQWMGGRERAGQGGRFEATSSDRVRKLKRDLRNLGRTCRAVEADLVQAESADELEKMGSLIMTHLSAVSRGQSRVELPDSFDPAGAARVGVELDPLLGPVENAARYLKRARRLRRRLNILPTRLRRLRQQQSELEGLLSLLQEGKEVPMSVLESEGLRDRDPRQQTQARTRGEGAHPRRYLTSSGWAVWAGRNNRENDVLTHKMAAQDDVWFHAHGYSGSHVVLRRAGRKDEPSSRTLHEAAAVAAYWSKGRTARKVAVVYTTVKFVTKPKGSPAGLAVLRREKTLMVAPALLPLEGEGGSKEGVQGEGKGI
jgi:predicted ribosome quality control (RQC) complex YloA/Tae2 family protein